MKTKKLNYRPIIGLPEISKIYEILIGSQINHFLEKKWSNLIAAFKQGHSMQDTFLIGIESWH